MTAWHGTNSIDVRMPLSPLHLLPVLGPRHKAADRALQHDHPAPEHFVLPPAVPPAEASLDEGGVDVAPPNLELSVRVVLQEDLA